MFGVGLAASAFTSDLCTEAASYGGPSSNSSLAKIVPCADATAVGASCKAVCLCLGVVAQWVALLTHVAIAVGHWLQHDALPTQSSTDMCTPQKAVQPPLYVSTAHLDVHLPAPLQGAVAVTSGVLLVEDLVLQINDVLNRTNSVSLSDTLGRLLHIREANFTKAFCV